MESLSWTLWFSFFSALICSLLALLSVKKMTRNGGVSFFVLCFAMGAWQFGKFAKNTELLDFFSIDFWNAYSIWGATFVYPAFFQLCWKLFAYELKWAKYVSLMAWGSVPIYLGLFHGGWFFDGYSLTDWGMRHKPKLVYWLYSLQYVFFMVLGLGLIYSKRKRYSAGMRLPGRLVFVSSLVGFVLGALEFLDVFWMPLFPIADLAPACFAAGFYWAMVYFDFLDSSSLLRSIGRKGFLFFSSLALLMLIVWFVDALASLGFANWTIAILMAFMFLCISILLKGVWQNIKKEWEPIASQSSRNLMKLSGGLSSINSPEDAIDFFRDMLQTDLSFNGISAVLTLENKAQQYWGAADYSKYHLLKMQPEPIYKNELIRLLHLQYPDKRMDLTQYGKWKILQRLSCDIVLPISLEGRSTLFFWMQKSQLSHENYENVKPHIHALVSLLGDYINQWVLQDSLNRERELSQIGLMASELAHEIKNPLEGIYGAAQLLEEEKKGNQVFVEMILKDSRRLNQAVQDYLFLARPYAIVQEIKELQSWVCNESLDWKLKGIHVVIVGDLNPVSIKWDFTSLSQCLLNLVQNASRYSPGDKEILLRIGLDTENIYLTVEDRGDGVSPENQERLFRPFFTTDPKGNGLGLAFSKKMVCAQGGDITYNRIDSKSCFQIKAPRKIQLENQNS